MTGDPSDLCVCLGGEAGACGAPLVCMGKSPASFKIREKKEKKTDTHLSQFLQEGKNRKECARI